jgi:hypothetical protein
VVVGAWARDRIGNLKALFLVAESSSVLEDNRRRLERIIIPIVKLISTLVLAR